MRTISLEDTGGQNQKKGSVVPQHWIRGAQILQQDLMFERLITSRPETVVVDESEHLVLYTHPHAPYRSATLKNRQTIPLRHRMERILDIRSWNLEERRSGNYHTLSIYPPESWYSIWLMWSLEWEFRNAYVNFQSPYQRSERGILVEDLALDIVVGRGGSWSWKDEDEFGEMIRAGIISKSKAESVRSISDGVIALIEGQSGPFAEHWKEWRPCLNWPTPQLPSDWDRIPER